MQQVIEQDKVESGAINDAIEKNQEIQSYTTADPSSVDDFKNESTPIFTDSEEEEEKEEEQALDGKTAANVMK
jgi:hypothetical protein